jgi:hypothetical protein
MKPKYQMRGKSPNNRDSALKAVKSGRTVKKLFRRHRKDASKNRFNARKRDISTRFSNPLT